jgi:acetyltransferase-like isoleucine patch superfamily enzyme
MADAYRFLGRSAHPLARFCRRVYRVFSRFSLPAPRLVVIPCLGAFRVGRGIYHFLLRVLVCEPLFKGYCTRYGRHLRTDIYIHWVQGSGDLILGDDVFVDGKCSFTFARRFAERPTLQVGDRTGIGHGCSFTVGKRISIGSDCRIAAGVHMFDSNGHPTDPEARQAGSPPPTEEVRPITVGDNVWIGRGVLVFPGTTIGANSVISAGAVVTGDVPPNTVAAGNPARRVASLDRKEA